MVKSWTDNLVNQFANEVIGKTKKPGLYIDDVPYYVDCHGRLSLKPRSGFREPTIDQLLKIIKKYDPEHTVSSAVLNHNISNAMVSYGVPVRHIELFTYLVTINMTEVGSYARRAKAIPKDEDNVNILSKLCDYVGNAILKLHQSRVNHVMVNLTDKLTLTIYVKDRRYHTRIRHTEASDVSLSYTPGDYLYIHVEEKSDLNSFMFYGSPGIPTPSYTESHLHLMIGELLHVLDNLEQLECILDNAISETIKITDEPRGRDYVVIKEGKLYGNDATLGNYYNDIGEPLTLNNIVKCKDSNVIIKGSLDKTLITMISSIAYAVTSE